MYILNTNKKKKPYKLKLNRFANLTVFEFLKDHTCSKIQDRKMIIGSNPFIYENVKWTKPWSFVWRQKKKGGHRCQRPRNVR